MVAPVGNIANPAMLDTLSSIPTTIYPPLPIGGVLMSIPTVLTNEGKENEEAIQIMDVQESKGSHPQVAGVNPVFPFIPVPSTIDRNIGIVPVKNLSVYFEGKLVTIAGDGLATAPPTIPPIRPIVLSSPSQYATIIIGTNPVI